jgi:hypothetical protein
MQHCGTVFSECELLNVNTKAQNQAQLPLLAKKHQGLTPTLPPTLRHMLASGFSCSTRGGGCGSGGGNRGMSTELLILLPRLLGTLPIPLDVRIALFRPRLTRASGSACAGSGSSTSDSVARYRSNNAGLILYHIGFQQLISQDVHTRSTSPSSGIL